MTTTAAGRYVDVNGIGLYVETHGSGRPLVLLHGGLMSGEMFAPILPALTETRQVITVDLQGHGRTADIDRPLSPATMAADVAALIEHLGLDRPDLVGYSLGGGVALHVAAQHPALIGRLVLTSVYIRSDALDPAIAAQQSQVNGAAAEFMIGTPPHELYQRVAPRPEDFPRLLDKLGGWMADEFDYTDEIRGLRMPTLIMAADADMAPVRHFADVFALLDGGLRDGGWDGSGRPDGGHALAILPGRTHYDITDSPLFAASVLDFLTETHPAEVS
ncbi:alpha/beta fold hydrolase [Pseudonocardia xishanensis]|uniref:Alpha/beta hydrolase n=1 Tax=Pseudonocardia xishanensis TaxID=630995 RepID=A0ABP8S2T7_9PSEU